MNWPGSNIWWQCDSSFTIHKASFKLKVAWLKQLYRGGPCPPLWWDVIDVYAKNNTSCQSAKWLVIANIIEHVLMSLASFVQLPSDSTSTFGQSFPHSLNWMQLASFTCKQIQHHKNKTQHLFFCSCRNRKQFCLQIRAKVTLSVVVLVRCRVSVRVNYFTRLFLKCYCAAKHSSVSMLEHMLERTHPK